MGTQHTVDDDLPVVYLFIPVPYSPPLMCRAFYLLPLCLIPLQPSDWDHTLHPINSQYAYVSLQQQTVVAGVVTD